MAQKFKVLTTDNWLEPDPTSTMFMKFSHSDESVSSMSGEDWVSQFLSPKLKDTVPEEVRALFEVARGSLAYGCFFYPLYALAGEQLFRVAEAAVSIKSKLYGASEKSTFYQNLKSLLDSGVISNQEYSDWENIRKLRNEFSHPKQQNILPPGAVATLLYRVADKINALFD